MTLLIATCKEYPNLTPDDQPLLRELDSAGVKWKIADWRDSTAWASATHVLIRSPWDYYQHIDEFRSWLRRLDESGVRVFNQTELIVVNLDKRYLRDMEANGTPTIPTIWLESTVDWAAAKQQLILEREYVVKPSISAGAFRTRRISGRDLVAMAEDGELAADEFKSIAPGSALMIQEFAPEIPRDGEWSCLFFGEEFSHAVIKRAKPKDFRVQWSHGGTHHRAELPRDVLAQVRKIHRSIHPRPLYARVDGIVRNGQFLLVELEMTEPYLFLGEHGPAAQLLVQAIVRLL